MKKMLLAGAALAVLFTGSAVAADLPARPALAPVAVYNWTGCYIGGHLGGVISDKEWFDATPGSPTFGQSYGTHSPSNQEIGLQGGCDYQAGMWLVGLQGDYGWADIRDGNRNRLVANLSDRSTIKSLGTVTARVGIAWNIFLGYLKGGAAWEKDQYEFYQHANEFVTATAGETRTGWTAGFGVEMAFLPPVSGFVEASYFDFGKKSVTFTPAGGGATFPVDINDRKVVVRGGINWRFGSAVAPVVSK